MRHAVPKGEPVHVTLRVRSDLLSLRSKRLVREFRRTLRRGCERGEFRGVYYSLQGNHAHLVVEAAGKEALARGMKSIGAQLARAIDRCSSGRWFDRSRTPPRAPPDPTGGRCEVASAKSWSLGVGWRRSGLIAFSEVPGRAR